MGQHTRRNSNSSTRSISIASARDGRGSQVSSQGGYSRRNSVCSLAPDPLQYTMNFYVDFTSHIPGSKSLRALGVSREPRFSEGTMARDYLMEVFDLKELLRASLEQKEADEMRITLAKMSRRVWDISMDPKKTDMEKEEARARLDKYTTSHFEIEVSQAFGWDVNLHQLVVVEDVDDFRLVKKSAASHGRPRLSRNRSSTFSGLKRRRSSLPSGSLGGNSRRQSVVLSDSQQLRAGAYMNV